MIDAVVLRTAPAAAVVFPTRVQELVIVLDGSNNGSRRSRSVARLGAFAPAGYYDRTHAYSRRAAPGELPVTRLKARLNAASDPYPTR